MIRAALASVSLLVVGPLFAADLPKDISPEDRAEWLKRWRDDYTKKRDEAQAKATDAKALLKFAATAPAGKKQLAEAVAELSRLEKNPLIFTGSPFRTTSDRGVAVGDVLLVSGSNAFVLGAELKGVGVVAERGVVLSDGKGTIIRFLVASPITLPKPVGKKPVPVDLSGLWYLAGQTEYEGKPIAVLYKFDIKPSDFPPAK